MTGLKTRILGKFLQLPFVIGVLILLPAGTFDFWQVYVYFGIIIVLAVAAMAYFLKNDPELIERRMRTKEKEQTQKSVVGVLAIVVIASFMVPGFDRRFGWSSIPAEICLLADLFVVVGYGFIAYVMKVNSYASRVVEVEQDQKVIDTGPYAIVRHPMYSAVLIMYGATPIALGSWWGLVPVALLPVLITIRILNEEKVLQQDLAGYREYCERLRWRLIPFIW